MSKTDPKLCILSYLKQQNRPYSANDITLNLKDFGKTSILKALDELASSEQIREKTYGKQKVYAPLQDDSVKIDEMGSIIKELDVKISKDSETLSDLQQKLKAAESELKISENALSTENALKLSSQLNQEISELEEKLNLLKDGGIKISVEDKIKITQENEQAQKEYRKRKRICMDIANQILESYPKTKKIFLEEVGIETDEDVSR